MIPSVEPFPSFFCRLYHDGVGIHTFEMHYHFSLPDEQVLLQYIWKNIISTSPRCPHNRQMVSLIPGLHAQMLSTDVGQILKLIINPRVMVDGAEGYCRITDSDANKAVFRRRLGHTKLRCWESDDHTRCRLQSIPPGRRGKDHTGRPPGCRCPNGGNRSCRRRRFPHRRSHGKGVDLLQIQKYENPQHRFMGHILLTK